MKINFADSPAQNKERVFLSLEECFANSSITVDEYEHRLEGVIAAVDNAQIAELAADLPAVIPAAAHTESVQPHSRSKQTTAQTHAGRTTPQTWRGKASSMLLSIFGGAARKGAWHVPQVLFMFSLFGGNEIDFSEAVFPENGVQLVNVSIFGGNTVLLRGSRTDIPKITVTSFSLFGGSELQLHKAAHLPADGIHVETCCVFGGFDIRVPDNAGVHSSGIGIFGGAPNVSLSPESDSDGYVDVKSLSVFGGVSVKNASGKNL